MPADPVALAQGLLRCRSVTPEDGGALSFLETTLKAAGFAVHRMTFSDTNTPDIENLYARIGTGSPHLMFAGHTDVVPPGNESDWSHAPFAAEIRDGILYGRGAVDMKGGIAACLAAALDHLQANGGKPKGSISFLIAGDEESVAVNGTIKLLDWAHKHGEIFDHCILAEPSNREVLGDTIKIGRRGSQNGMLIVHGKQGHVAYPERADNPVMGLVKLITALKAEPLDRGSKLFDASNLEFTSIDIGNKTVNLIPGEARARFNIRFNDLHDQESLKILLEKRALKAGEGKIRFSFEWEPSNADVFVVEPGPFTDTVANAIAEVTGRKPVLSTTGGTSDARFIKNYCSVVEFGLVGQTMHAVDERVPVAELVSLTGIYKKILDRYFGS
jgi:succinyl-diaminopimelate desuccinylase